MAMGSSPRSSRRLPPRCLPPSPPEYGQEMAVRIGAGLSTELDPSEGAIAAATDAGAGLGGDACDLAIVFASGSHLAAPEATLEGVHEALSPGGLVGCGAAGVLGGGREIEDGTAVSVLALSLDAGRAEP